MYNDMCFSTWSYSSSTAVLEGQAGGTNILRAEWHNSYAQWIYIQSIPNEADCSLLPIARQNQGDVENSHM